MEIKDNDGRTTPMNMSYTNYKTMERVGEGTTTTSDLDSTHLSFVAKQCKLRVWGKYMIIPSKFLSYQFLSWFGNSVSSCILLYKKTKKNVLLSTLNKSLPGGCPRITRFVLMLIYLRIKLNHASCNLYLFLYALV